MTNTKAFTWITSYQTAKPPGPGLQTLIPDIFDRYFLVPWTVGIMDNFPFDEYPASNWATADLNRQHAIERELGIFFKKDIGDLYREISREELAARFSVPYTADTPSLVKRSPGLAGMPDLFLQRVDKLLRQLQHGTALCLYAIDESRYASADDPWPDIQFRMLDEVPAYLAFQDDTDWDTDSCLFPQDHAWCLCTLESFTHLIFGCSDAVYATLRVPDGLELFKTAHGFPERR